MDDNVKINNFTSDNPQCYTASAQSVLYFLFVLKPIDINSLNIHLCILFH